MKSLYYNVCKHNLHRKSLQKQIIFVTQQVINSKHDTYLYLFIYIRVNVSFHIIIALNPKTILT